MSVCVFGLFSDKQPDNKDFLLQNYTKHLFFNWFSKRITASRLLWRSFRSRMSDVDFSLVHRLHIQTLLTVFVFLSLRQIKLSLGKERQCQPLTTQIIPAHLAAVAAAAAAAINNSFSHRTNHATNHHHHTPALFQTQTLPAALLRPAPGPVRTSHPQVLFAPYWPAWPPGGSAPPPVKDQNHELPPAQAKESRQHLCSFLCIRDTEHPHTVIGPLPRLSAPRMEYPASKDKPDCGEASGSLTIDLFLYSHRNPRAAAHMLPVPHCSPWLTPGRWTWSHIVPQ